MPGFFCCYQKTPKVRHIYRETHQPSEDSLKRAQEIIDSTIDVAEGTDDELKRQGQQIDRIDNTVGDIQTDTQIAERDLRGVGSCWGYFWNRITPCCRPKHRAASPEPEAKQPKLSKRALPTDDKQAIGAGLDKLQELADGMGTEIDRQNGVLNDLDHQVSDTADNIASTCKKTTATRVQIGGSV